MYRVVAMRLSHPTPARIYSSRSNRHRRPLNQAREIRTEQYLALERMLERFKGSCTGCGKKNCPTRRQQGYISLQAYLLT
jgi:hypothetical protein